MRALVAGIVLIAIATFAGAAAVAQQAGQGQNGKAPTFIDQEMAALHALDKIAARVSQMYVPVGGKAEFGRLVIDVQACRKRPPQEPPEAAAFLDIVDSGRDGTAVDVFRGWMFASSPSLSAMEHPLYDIWVAGCMSAGEAETAQTLARTGGVEDMGEDEVARARGKVGGVPVPQGREERR